MDGPGLKGEGWVRLRRGNNTAWDWKGENLSFRALENSAGGWDLFAAMKRGPGRFKQMPLEEGKNLSTVFSTARFFWERSIMRTASSSHNVADRYLVLQTARHICASDQAFGNRTASLRDFTPEVLAAFGEAFVLNTATSERHKVALLGGLGRKLKQIWRLIKKAPQVWPKIKEFLGVESAREIPRKIKEWGSRGLKYLKKALGGVLKSNPITALYFVPRDKMPSLTDMVKRISTVSDKIKNALSRVNTRIIKPIDEYLAKHPILKGLSAPILAAIFIWVWLNVTEVSWSLDDLIKGFTGNITVSELFSSFPESGIGFIIAVLFPGLGTFALLPFSVMARVLWLLHKKLVAWVKGKGFLIHWDRMGVQKPNEFIGIF